MAQIAPRWLEIMQELIPGASRFSRMQFVMLEPANGFPAIYRDRGI
jgi:hypothetical protein